MDVFLVGFSFAAPDSSAEFRALLEVPGYGARQIRDWSSLTADDTRWGIVVDAPDALSLRHAADRAGLEITQAIRLVPDGAVYHLGDDWAATLADVLPGDPPPRLSEVIQPGGIGSGMFMTLLPDVKACGVCGWIGEHDPQVPHPG